MDTDPKPSTHSRSRSRSPARRRSASPTRRRSRSPPRKPRSSASGFRWKDKLRRDDERDDDRGLSRGYRAQERRERDRLDESNRWNDRGRDDRWRRDGRDRYDDRDRRDRDRKNDRDRNGNERSRDESEKHERKEKKGKRKEEKPTPAAAPTNEPMILVTVNDRLGTKAQIPCLASDPIKLFKAQVAARIGRQPHEIMLKRQGERPFKDHLTLEDYGVSSGVQLDLELDTGD